MILRLLAFLALGATLHATEPVGWERVTVPSMKTSIYVGSVTLNTGDFIRHGEGFSTTYEAKVVPWFFWSESGKIMIDVSADDLAQLDAGQAITFTGHALNHKKKPRKVSGQAQPADGSSGKIKVRIQVDNVELIFNGTYRLARS
ncbi:MAG: hypothetical protein Q8J74_02370 [Candidatus Didemnitutus sp.]|nr:hypothetical protein [Candidatus Didemnitutus sp.]